MARQPGGLASFDARFYPDWQTWLISNVASGSTWHTCEDISPAVELDACDEVLVAFLTHGTPPDGQNAGSTTWFFDSR